MRISDWSSDVCSSDLIYGDIGAEQAIALVGKTFGALPPRKDAPVDPANVKTAFPAHNEAPLVLRHKGAKDQAAAVMAWPTAGGFAGARESRQLEILPQIFNDRLFEGLRSQAGAAYSHSVDNNSPFYFDNGTSEERRVGTECVSTC